MNTPSTWDALTLDSAKGLIDLSGGRSEWEAVADQQLRGAIDLYARLGDQRVVWLSDEVGLGKTYVAMAVAALVRHEHPNARILYLLPTTRLLPKWKRELGAFARRCVRHADHNLKTIEGTSARPLVETSSMRQLALEAAVDPHRDFLCTLGAFSFGLASQQESTIPDGWRRQWHDLLRLLPEKEREPWRWERLRARLLETDEHHRKYLFKQAYSELLNSRIPTFDLVICDESHNLKGGLQSDAARNLTASILLGGVPAKRPVWSELQLEPRVQRLLCMTATPFSRSYAELGRQASVFGFHERGWGVERAPVLGTLGVLSGDADDRLNIEALRTAAAKLIIRRLGVLTPRGTDTSLTRNQYRTEHRAGGMKHAEAPLPEPSIADQLVLAMVQKRVFDALATRRSDADEQGPPNLRFQMGVLSSFESFSQTLDTRMAKDRPMHEGEVDEEARNDAEREANALDSLIQSWEDAFQRPMPHPKMGEVARAVADQAVRGEKSLVFVRRVKTTDELGRQVARRVDDHILAYVHRSLPNPAARQHWNRVGEAYRAWVKHNDDERLRASREPEEDADTQAPKRARPRNPTERAEVPSIFSWYFRMSEQQRKVFNIRTRRDEAGFAGAGGFLTSITLTTPRNIWPALLADNAVLGLFGHDVAALRNWALQPGRSKALWAKALRFAYVNQATGDRATRLYGNMAAWFDAYQAAALWEMAESPEFDEPVRRVARLLRGMRYPSQVEPGDAHPGEPSTETVAAWVTLPTLFAQLSDRASSETTAQLSALWPSHDVRALSRWEASEEAVSAGLHRRELERTIIVQLLRNGLSYLDLWLAVAEHRDAIGPDAMDLQLGHEGGPEHATEVFGPIGRRWLERLCAPLSKAVGGLNSYRELSQAAANHDLLITQNFPEADRKSLRAAERQIRTTLTGQGPVVALHGGSKSIRAMQQFRMPGFPLVMVATSVVQEGVDLHTFCRRVVHYGIDGTSTGTEQRNGRVDRRGSLIERLLGDEATASERIQVYFPHLRRSLEPLQMVTLYRRLDRFLAMAHQVGLDQTEMGRDWVSTAEAVIQGEATYPTAYQERLETAFPDREPSWSRATEDIRAAHPIRLQAQGEPPSIEPLLAQIREQQWPVDPQGHRRLWSGTATLQPSGRVQPFLVTWRSGAVDDGSEDAVWPFCLRIESPVRPYDLNDLPDGQTEALSKWDVPGLALVARERSRFRWSLWVRSEVMFAPGRPVDGDRLFAWLLFVLREADKLELALCADGRDHAMEAF